MKLKTKIVLRLLIILEFVSVSLVFGQFSDRSLVSNKRSPGINPDSYISKPVQLIDIPTASILRGGDIKSSFRLYEQGGTLARLSVGISNKVMFGISYGGSNIIGNGKINWNDAPGVHFVVRVMEEDLVKPALVAGFDSQGYGPFYEKTEPSVDSDGNQVFSDRYSIKSRGFYVAASKGYASVVKIGLHGGISYSLESSDGDKSPTLFLGMDAALTRDISLLAEYDFASNDDKIKTRKNNKGYFNAGVRWVFTDYMFLEFDFKNIYAENVDGMSDVKRIIKFVYFGTIK